jgi:hypothetical protein
MPVTLVALAIVACDGDAATLTRQPLVMPTVA